MVAGRQASGHRHQSHVDGVGIPGVEGLEFREKKRAAFAASRALPATSKDGVSVSLLINAGLLIDLDHLHDSGAAGVGLYRTEIPFMIRAQFPRVDAQTALYREILDRANGKPVVFRTLDIGGDKFGIHPIGVIE